MFVTGAEAFSDNQTRPLPRTSRDLPGFAYDAMREKGAAGLVWDADTLERYVADPESVVAGTSMSAPPLRDKQERTDLIAYLALSGRYRP
jgi:cytochrome c